MIEPNNGANAVLGVADLTGNGRDELIFAGASQQIRYLDSNGDTTKVQNGGVGSNNGIGVGEPADLNQNGVSRVATVTGSNEVKLTGVSEPDIMFPSTNAKKSLVTVSDVDTDGNKEIAYISTNGIIMYIDDPMTDPQTKELTDENGNTITADDDIGIVSG